MAREVSVKITANTSGFNSGMNSAAGIAARTAASIRGSFDSALSGVGKNSRAINSLSSGLGKVGVVAAVGIGAAIKSAAEFDSAMSSVAATGSDARASLGALREAAIKAGADTKFSATEAAGGLEALAKAGVSSKDALGGGLAGALNLAAAGNQSVAESAETAASAMNQFGLQGKDVPRIADLLAQAAGTAQGEVSDMAAALNQSGLVANQFGLSIEDSTQALALFAQNGLVGSDAGTSFKTMLTSLYAPAGTGAKALDKLGVSAYDAGGALKPIGEVADDLKVKLDGLSEQDRNQALKNIFGSDALRTGTILLNEGSAGLTKMAGEFGKFGTAADVARTKMDNLKGDLEQLKGSAETALIGLGEGGAGPLRGLTQDVTAAINGFNKLGDGTKSAILAVGGIGAASALGVAGVLKLATGAAEVYGAFGKLSSSMPRLAGALGGLGAAAAIAVGALIALRAAGAGINALMGDNATTTEQAAQAIARMSQTAGQGTKSLDDFFAFTTTGDITVGAQEIDTLDQAFSRLENRSGMTKINDGLTGFISSVSTVKGSAEIITDRFGQLDDRLSSLASTNGPQAAQSFQAIAKAAADQGVPLERLVELFPSYAASVRSVAEANGGSVSSTQQLVDIMSGGLPSGVQTTSSALDTASAALDVIGSASSGAATDVNALGAALFATGNRALEASNAQIGFEAAVDAAAAAAKKNGDNLNVATAAGRENKAALNQLAAAGQGYVQSLIEQGESSKTVKGAVEDARSAYVAQARAMGESKRSANDLADAAGLIPKNVSVTVDAKAGNAKAELAQVEAAIKGLPKDQQVEVRAAFKAGGLDAAKAKIAELKDKSVTVTAKGNTQGATKVDQAMKNLDNRTVTATAKGNPSGARTVKSAVDSVKGKTVTVKVNANASGAYEARRAIATVNGKTVTVTVRRVSKGDADGGPIWSTLPRFDSGGRINGAGGPREDNVMGVDRKTGLQTSWVSVGEFVTNAKSYANNARVVETINANPSKQFKLMEAAAGGAIRGFATGGSVGTTLTSDPEILKALTAQFRVDQAENLKDRRAADKALAKAMKKLNDTQSTALESIKSLSNTLQEPYRSKSTDAADVLASLQEGAADLSAFGSQLKQLKALGLDQGVIDQITAGGAVNGGELASQILAGGQGLVNSLNQANANLVKASSALGLTAGGIKGFAAGGYTGTVGVNEPAGVVHGREYVVNADATAKYRSALDAINYGRAQINEHRFMPGQAGGGSVAQSVNRSINDSSQIVLQGDFGGIDRAFSAARAKKQDNLTMARLTVAI